MATDYIRWDTAHLYAAPTGTKKKIELLWGDRVTTLTTSGARRKVRVRGVEGYVSKAALGGSSLLEIYFIDVGQGDGVLIRTPDHRHVLIDGGYKRSRQQTRKNAADFVDWKFARDYRKKKIELDAMIASHCDADHYGGLWDLINPNETDELDLADVRVEAFYHAGVGWWQDGGGSRWLGPYVEADDGKDYFTRLIGDRTHITSVTAAAADPRSQGEWGEFLETVTKVKKKNGHVCPIRRLTASDDGSDTFVPGFEESSSDVSMKVIAPIETSVSGTPAIRRHSGGNSINTNGNSVLLRLDYGRARVLLTGDLSTASMQGLLDEYAGSRQEFACDVGKACLHGSDDVSYAFLAAMRPAVTVISSGDNEGHDHPRPGVIAASAMTGYLETDGDKIVTPLIYSTELARSYKLADTEALEVATTTAGSDHDRITGARMRRSRLDLGKRNRSLGSALIVNGIIYGLVNVRTDGEKILCATRNEKDSTWQVKTLQSRF